LPDVSRGVGADIAAERILVVVDRDAPIGCFLGGMIDRMWHGANIAVSPSPAGTGVGSALMRFAVAQALRDGVDEMALARHRDMPRNVALYQRLGWQVWGEDGNRIMMHRDTAA
jgi:GNAT superfamily N-acetyltransferase